jgi:hypothetical protein
MKAVMARKLASLGFLAGVAALALAGPAQASETRGFAITWFMPAMYNGDDDCPKGMQPSIDFKDLFTKQGRSAAEVKDLIDHPISPPFVKALIYRGKDGANVCEKPTSAADPGLITAEGSHAFGMDLDGAADDAHPAPNSCQHKSFLGPNGEKGVDNQLYRIIGCMEGHRGSRGNDGFVFQYIMERMRAEGMMTYLLEVSGIDDEKNDPDVEVSVYLGADPLVQDARGEVPADTTQRINPDPRWHNQVHGSIKDGVLQTDPFELHLLGSTMWMPVLDFKNAQLRLTLNQDGTAKGVLGGYVGLESLYYNSAKSGFLFEVFSSGNCPGTYYALKRMADGYPDPKTGECTALSAAYTIEAIRAFVVHPAGEKPVQSAQSGN